MSTPSGAYKIWRHPHLKLVDKCLQYVVWLAMRLDKLDSVAKLAGPEGATARRRFEQFNAGAAARFAKHWTTTVETTPEGVELIVYSPKDVDSPVPVVLWIHGGGFTIGGARDAFGAELCAAAVQAGAPPFVWVSVEYRLAPERASRAELNPKIYISPAWNWHIHVLKTRFPTAQAPAPGGGRRLRRGAAVPRGGVGPLLGRTRGRRVGRRKSRNRHGRRGAAARH